MERGKGMKHACKWLLVALLIASAPGIAGSVAYTYDSLGRVVRVVYTVGSTTTTLNYTYAAAGNRVATVATSP